MSKIQKALGEIQKKSGKADKREQIRVNDVSRTTQYLDQTIILPSVNRRKVIINWKAGRDGGVAASSENSEELKRQLRDIKRPLIGNAFGKRATKVENGNMILVTSALSGEGKTFVSFNLACSMAQERDHTVVLVDADVANPHTSEVFGIQNEIGLLDILERPELSVESAIFDTDIPGLGVLGAGKPRINATELLASAQMERLTRQLASADRNRIVIFDSPPLLLTSESKVLASFVGQILMIVGAENTPKGAVDEAVDLISTDKALNLVLNMATTSPIGVRPSYGQSYPARDARNTKAEDESATIANSGSET